MSKGKESKIPSSVHFVSGSLAGAVQTAFWNPLDVLKTRMQVRDALVEGGGMQAYRSSRHAIASIMSSEGPLGFFRGVLPSVLGSSLAWGIQMPLYAYLKHLIGAESVGMHRSFFEFAPRDWVCSLFAGCLTNTVVHPVFLIKTRMQLQPCTRGGVSVDPATVKPAYRNSAHAVMSILREEGVAGFYSGFAPSLLLCTHGAVLLASYDHFKAVYPSAPVASFFAKIFATSATYPLQVVRSVMQQRPTDANFPYKDIRKTVQILWEQGGITAFYRGICPQMMRTVPQSMAFFSIYECMVRTLTSVWTIRPMPKQISCSSCCGS